MQTLLQRQNCRSKYKVFSTPPFCSPGLRPLHTSRSNQRPAIILSSLPRTLNPVFSSSDIFPVWQLPRNFTAKTPIQIRLKPSMASHGSVGRSKWMTLSQGHRPVSNLSFQAVPHSPFCPVHGPSALLFQDLWGHCGFFLRIFTHRPTPRGSGAQARGGPHTTNNTYVRHFPLTKCLHNDKIEKSVYMHGFYDYKFVKYKGQLNLIIVRVRVFSRDS